MLIDGDRETEEHIPALITQKDVHPSLKHINLCESRLRIGDQAESNSFQRYAAKYAAYLETPEGRLRLDLTLANLQEFLRPAKESLCALDVGGGTGAIAVRLARLGFNVTLLDSSSTMLNLAQHVVRDAGVAEKIRLQIGDAARLAELFPMASFDVILCHNLLEYVDDPQAVIKGAARVMRDSLAVLSILVRNRAGEVLKAAIQAGDLASAEENINAEWTKESLYGSRVRLFATDDVEAMLKMASLTVVAKRGVRVIADYLPPQISRDAEYERIFELERKLARLPEFAVARYTHFLARRMIEDRA